MDFCNFYAFGVTNGFQPVSSILWGHRSNSSLTLHPPPIKPPVSSSPGPIISFKYWAPNLIPHQTHAHMRERLYRWGFLSEKHVYSRQLHFKPLCRPILLFTAWSVSQLLLFFSSRLSFLSLKDGVFIGLSVIDRLIFGFSFKDSLTLILNTMNRLHDSLVSRHTCIYLIHTSSMIYIRSYVFIL